jgi:hypothetical protein
MIRVQHGDGLRIRGGGVFIPPFLMRYQSLATNAGTRTQKPSFSVLAVMLLGCPKS